MSNTNEDLTSRLNQVMQPLLGGRNGEAEKVPDNSFAPIAPAVTTISITPVTPAVSTVPITSTASAVSIALTASPTTARSAISSASSLASAITVAYSQHAGGSAGGSNTGVDTKNQNEEEILYDADPNNATEQLEKRSTSRLKLTALISEVLQPGFALPNQQNNQPSRQYTKEDYLKFGLHCLVKTLVVPASGERPRIKVHIQNWNDKFVSFKDAGATLKSLAAQHVQAAIVWLSKAADQNERMAQYLLGEIEKYNYDPKAIPRLTCAAENGNDLAQFILGELYYYGFVKPKPNPKEQSEENVLRSDEILLQPNPALAFKYYAKAAKNRSCIAQQCLAYCYLFGNGTQKNIDKGLYWLITALGDEKTAKKLREPNQNNNDGNNGNNAVYEEALKRLEELKPNVKKCECIVM